ncbi:MAG TPA: ChbG/HpnK family deacetylase [Pirellulales bacterium]|nr:ChbG/HpnK family deacetylase [Pirellulales bacterium]
MSHAHAPRVVLHADDLGLNHSVTRGILEGFEAGVLTSAALLANAPAAEQALDAWQALLEAHRAGRLASTAARRRLGDSPGDFDLGVHLNLTQGRPLTGQRFPRQLLNDRGEFLPPGQLFSRLIWRGGRCRDAIHAELAMQVELLMAHGLEPTHLNGHQYVELMPVVCELVPRLAADYAITAVRVPREPRHWLTSLRPGFRPGNWLLSYAKQWFARRYAARIDAAGCRHAGAYFGASHAGCVDMRVCEMFLCAGRGRGLVEIAFHPGFPGGEFEADRWSAPTQQAWSDPLATWRPAELALLCSPAFGDLIERHGWRLGRLGSLTTERAAAA